MMLMAEKGKSDALVDEFRREREAASDKLDLGYLLRKLDGLESGDGRIIIATTNHPERIDPALMRPGRFGIQLNFTRCTHGMLVDIVSMIYKVEGPKKTDLAKKLTSVPSYKWSPVEVLQMGITLPNLAEMVAGLKAERPPELATVEATEKALDEEASAAAVAAVAMAAKAPPTKGPGRWSKARRAAPPSAPSVDSDDS
jgi:SpoVK/Ycf46/Vps4 family AAA+-type ATPase